MNKFDLVLKEINTITKNAEDKTEHGHSQSVWQWTLKLKPDADAALQIAALGHDIDRSFEDYRQMKARHETYAEYKKEHVLQSAKIICDILKKHNFDKTTIKKVKQLIEDHEIGGKGDVEILITADSLAFFNNLVHYQEEHTEQETLDKIKYMYDRLSDKAKSMIKKIDLENAGLKRLFIKAINKQNKKYMTKQDIKKDYATKYLGKTVSIEIDRQLGTKHPKHGFEYPVNYGFVPNTKAPDGGEVDAYLLGVKEAKKTFSGKCIAVIHRTNDNDDKIIVVPFGKTFSDEEIQKLTHFQEQYFESIIIRK